MIPITPQEFADRHLYPYKQHGQEILPMHCPYCHGGQRRDKYTFALNIDKRTFNCKRGSCGKTGTFSQLCKDFGETAERPFELLPPPKRVYEKPKTPVVHAVKQNSTMEQYLAKRGISRETWERRGVFEHEGNIAMPYYENGELVLMKFRLPRKPKKGESKSWREKGGKPVFWGMDLCTPDLPLVVTEGEMDTLACDEAGVPNVVSVPSGNSDLTCLDVCWDWIEQFHTVIIWPDNDTAGYDMLKRMIQRLGAWRCKIVKANRKDANEVLYFDGKQAVADAIKNAQPVPIQGLVRLADIETYDPTQATRVFSGFEKIDKVFGGFLMGQVSVWTGINSSGKSTLLGQVMLEAINQGYKVCAYSGELPAQLFRYWIDLQAAGPDYVKEHYDQARQTKSWKVKPQVIQPIHDWYREHFWIFDSFGNNSQDSLFEVFEYAARRYDVRVFLVDNLMTMVNASSDREYYQKQSTFVGRVVEFAHEHDVHVHLVAHPKKVDGRRVTKMDVGGSGDITNRADNVISVHRVKDDERKDLPLTFEGCSNIVEIFKSRFTGRQDIPIPLNFDDTCKRFFALDDPLESHKSYGWIKKYQQIKVGESA